MKKIAFLFVLFLVGGVVSCHFPDNNVAPGILYTVAVQTRQAELNALASLTPPTETPTATPLPSETPLPSSTPTATLEPSPTWITYEKGTAEAFILYYYDVANGTKDDPFYQWEADIFVPSAQFEQQVRILYELGYHSIGISDLVRVLENGGELPPRPVMFTFDSTQRGQYVNAYPILKKYGFMGNLMLTSAYVDQKNLLSLDQIKEMMASGWEIGSMGYRAEGGPLGQEIGQSKPMLEDLFGLDILAFSYPDGAATSEMINLVNVYGYKAAFAGDTRTYQHSYDTRYYIGRYLIRKDFALNDFLNILPWKEGNLSQVTMDWAIATPLVEPLNLPNSVDMSSHITPTGNASAVTTESTAVGETPGTEELIEKETNTPIP